jgi:hypothetical protein
MAKCSGVIFHVEVTEHWVLAYIGHQKTEVDAHILFIWLNYSAFAVIFRRYMFVVVLGYGQFLI